MNKWVVFNEQDENTYPEAYHVVDVAIEDHEEIVFSCAYYDSFLDVWIDEETDRVIEKPNRWRLKTNGKRIE
jgi:hypothetical protein